MMKRKNITTADRRGVKNLQSKVDSLSAENKKLKKELITLKRVKKEYAETNLHIQR